MEDAVLVLTRRMSQAIIIGDDIAIYVVDIKPDRVRLGISAPNEVRIYRDEMFRGDDTMPPEVLVRLRAGLREQKYRSE